MNVENILELFLSKEEINVQLALVLMTELESNEVLGIFDKLYSILQRMASDAEQLSFAVNLNCMYVKSCTFLKSRKNMELHKQFFFKPSVVLTFPDIEIPKRDIYIYKDEDENIFEFVFRQIDVRPHRFKHHFSNNLSEEFMADFKKFILDAT